MFCPKLESYNLFPHNLVFSILYTIFKNYNENTSKDEHEYFQKEF